jgi:hypothetical protein
MRKSAADTSDSTATATRTLLHLALAQIGDWRATADEHGPTRSSRHDASRRATPPLARIAQATLTFPDGMGGNRDFGIASRAGFD